MDAREVLFQDLRQQGRTLKPWQAEARAGWLASLAQVILSYPTAERQWACTVLVADDIAKQFPGMPLSIAYAEVAKYVTEASKEVRR